MSEYIQIQTNNPYIDYMSGVNVNLIKVCKLKKIVNSETHQVTGYEKSSLED